MCGITGMAGPGASLSLVRNMAEAIVHRGPDGDGFHSADDVTIGMRRLAIIDVPGGAQPVYNEDRTITAVFNGELYNYPALRSLLSARGHRFTTSGDSECLVHLYEEFGDDLVHQLRGMFAFAIWDSTRSRLLLARDRVGKKPLFWRVADGTISFGSELKALFADPALRRDLDPVALHHYLTYQYVPAPWSIVEGVQKLPPGSLLTFADGKASVRRYWKLDCSPAAVKDQREAEEQLRELLLEATRVRMMSERPLGAFLSGGIDSTAVVAAMARYSSAPVKTFCIGFTNKAFDEAPFARAVANYLGTTHHEATVDSTDVGELALLARHFDEPFADSSAIPTLQVARMASQHVTVVLNGDGGDESFGGYRRYAFVNKAAWIPRQVPFAGSIGSVLARSGSRQVRLIGRAAVALAEPPMRRYAHLMSYFTPAQSMALYTPGLAAQVSNVDPYELLYQAFADSRATTLAGRAMDADINTYLPGDLLVKVDIATMACSLEARSPFLDHHLMEWAAGLPLSWKVRGNTTKYLLRRAVRDWMPPELVDRPKMGFGVPLAAWLRHELREMSHDLLLDDTARSRGLFEPQAVQRLLTEHSAGHDHANRIWALLQFELWARTWLGAGVLTA